MLSVFCRDSDWYKDLSPPLLRTCRFLLPLTNIAIHFYLLKRSLLNHANVFLDWKLMEMNWKYERIKMELWSLLARAKCSIDMQMSSRPAYKEWGRQHFPKTQNLFLTFSITEFLMFVQVLWMHYHFNPSRRTGDFKSYQKAIANEKAWKKLQL